MDIGPFRRDEAAGAQGVVDTIRRACEEIGFFTITGHGVPDELVDRMYHTSRAFFDLPDRLPVVAG